MRVHIYYSRFVTYCGRSVAGIRRAVWENETFEIAVAIENGTLCGACAAAVGI